MKFLVLGASGMAGHTIALYLQHKGHEVTGFGRRRFKLCPFIQGDACDFTLLTKVILENNYDCIVNCIGILNEFAETDKLRAVYLNALLPHFLAKITAKQVARVIHLSTDCVFSGYRGDYVEDDYCDARSFYGRTKALGELIDDKNLTIRTSIIGPDINSAGIGLINWFMQQQGIINGYTRAIWTGQTTLQLAKTIEIAIKEQAYGLINAIPGQAISKYDLLQLCNLFLRNNEITINPEDTYVSNKSLKRTNYAFLGDTPDYKYMIEDLAKWMREHSALYPHYLRPLLSGRSSSPR